jgi:hypothetical protein
MWVLRVCAPQLQPFASSCRVNLRDENLLRLDVALVEDEAPFQNTKVVLGRTKIWSLQQFLRQTDLIFLNII